MANNHLYLLYRETLRKYRKFSFRFKKSLKNGSFGQLVPRAQKKIIARLKKLKRRLEQLSLQLKIAAATGGLILTLNVGTTLGQAGLGPFNENSSMNPLSPSPIGNQDYLAPAFVDHDGDGDLDMFLGTRSGQIFYYKNEGTATNPIYVDSTSVVDPFAAWNTGYGSSYRSSAPALIDIDGDSDLDVLIGSEYASGYEMFFYSNDNGVFNSFPSIISYTVSYGKPTFVDIDGDSDLDLFIGTQSDGIYFYRNNAGVFGSEVNNLDAAASGNYLAPVFMDLNGDSEPDAFVGDQNGFVRFFRNTGSEMFTQDDVLNPLDGIDFGGQAVPQVGDLDGDGDLDLIVGSSYTGLLRYFENQGGGSFVQRLGVDNPVGGVDVGAGAVPDFVDINGDGFLDIFIGSKDQDIIDYVNRGDGTFTEVGANGELSSISGSGSYPRHTIGFVDIDGDTDMDAFVGDSQTDSVRFFENTGGATLFTEVKGPANPLDLAHMLPPGSQRPEWKPTFADLDNDGDFDALIGLSAWYNLPVYKYRNTIKFYRNDGDNVNPSFTELDSVSNPLSFLWTETYSYSSYYKPTLVDIDHDGDYDVFIGEGYSYGPATGSFLFLENDGGTFTAQNGAANPLDGVYFDDPAIAFADLDQDGDLDAFIGIGGEVYGSVSGEMRFWENQNTAPVLNASGPDPTFTEGGPAVVLDNTIAITDDNAYMIMAEVRISNFVAGEDDLLFTDQLGITGSFNAGTLTLTGKATLADYETALRSVEYDNTSSTPDLTPRIVDMAVTDADATFPAFFGPKTVTIAPINSPPEVTTTVSTFSYTIGQGPLVIDPGIIVIDTDDTDLVSATVAITNNFVAGQDELGFTDQNGVIGSFDSGSGVLSLTGTSSVPNYQDALRSVTYENVGFHSGLCDPGGSIWARSNGLAGPLTSVNRVAPPAYDRFC